MNVLVLNCGSATIKFQILAIEERADLKRRECWLARGMIDRLGPEALVVFEGAGGAAHRGVASVPDHRAAVEHILGWVCSPASGLPDITKPDDVGAVGQEGRGRGAPPGPGRGQVQLPEGAGSEAATAACAPCHGLNLITNSWGYTKEGWEDRINTMMVLPRVFAQPSERRCLRTSWPDSATLPASASPMPSRMERLPRRTTSAGMSDARVPTMNSAT